MYLLGESGFRCLRRGKSAFAVAREVVLLEAVACFPLERLDEPYEPIDVCGLFKGVPSSAKYATAL